MRRILLLLMFASYSVPMVARAQAGSDTSNHVIIINDVATNKDVTRPGLLHCPNPGYPRSLHEKVGSGEVVVEMILDTLGNPEPRSLRIKSSPNDSLSTLTLRAALGCTYTPARYKEHAIRIRIFQPFEFK